MTYRNLDIETLDHRKTGVTERFRVRVMLSPAGEQRPEDAEEVKITSKLRQQVRQLANRDLTGEEIAVLGNELGDVLFASKARWFLDNSRARLLPGQKLRIRLKLGTYALADLPWEFARIGGEYLVFDPDISLVRYEIMDKPIGVLDPVGGYPLRLVAALANPAPTDDLNLAAERGNLEKALEGIENLIQPEFPGLEAPGGRGPTMSELNDAFLGSVHIFHFSGHGRFQGQMATRYGTAEGEGELLLAGPGGAEQPVKGEDIARMVAGKGVRLALLNACESGKRGAGETGPDDQLNPWTGVVPALTRKGIPAVVGMQFRIRDRNAIAFSRSFYRALAKGLSVDEAVFEGRKAIRARAIEANASDDERDWGVPVLYLRAEEQEGVLFPRPLAPSIQETTPTNGAAGVPRDLAEVRIKFDRQMRPGSWSVDSHPAFRQDAAQYRVEGDALIITRNSPARRLDANTTFEFTVNPAGIAGAGCLDRDGNCAQSQTFSFTTGTQPEDLPMPSPPPPTRVNRTALRIAIRDSFNLSQLETLCSDIQQTLEDNGIAHVKVSLQMIGGEGLEGQARELIRYMERYGLLDYLVAAVRQARPNAVF